MEQNTLLNRELTDFEISYSIAGQQSAMMPVFDNGDAMSSVQIELKMWEDPEYEDDNKISVATASIVRIPSSDIIVNQKAYGLDYEMYETMDYCGGTDLEVVACELELCEKLDVILALSENNIYYVDRFKVKKEFRNQGVGTFFMQMLPRWIRAIYGEYNPVITLIPAPIECNRENSAMYNNEKRRLVNFYKSVGFKTLKPRGSVLYYTFPKNEYAELQEEWEECIDE